MRSRSRLILLILGIVTLLAVSLSLLSNRLIRRIMEQGLEANATTLSRMRAESITDSMIRGDALFVRESIQEAARTMDQVAYIYVVGFDGSLYAHTFEGGFPRALANRLQDFASTPPPHLARFSTPDGPFLEVAHPLVAGMKAHIHVGVDQAPMRKQIREAQHQIIKLALGVAFCGVVLGLAVSRRFTRPLEQLAQRMRDYGGGSTPSEQDVHTGNPDMLEIEQAFNRMISDRKRIEGDLRESEERLSTLMANLPGMAYRCRNEPGWPMEFVSEGCLALTGYTSAELTDQGYAAYGDLVHPEDRQMVWGHVQESVRSGEPFVLEYRIRHKGGRQQWVWERGRVVEQAPGGPVILEGFISDITEQKEAGVELRSAQEQLAQAEKFAAIGRVSSGIAHEVNNPLASIASSAELLASRLTEIEEPDLRKTVGRHVGRIQQDVERCAEVIESVRGFTRREVGESVRVRVDELIERCITSFRAENILASREVRCSCKPLEIGSIDPELGCDWRERRCCELAEPCHVWGNPGQIDRVVTNLLRNAVEATEEDGVVAVGCRAEEDGVTLTIGDNGSGIAPGALPYVFEPFYSTKGTGGTGLGLYIVRQLITANGGEINCESEEGRGTIFRVRLPAAEAEGNDHGQT